jgi:tRNA threonylcarbamoyl adenosine modification protein (Sua5/YciO/YrdC/YwlC family)
VGAEWIRYDDAAHASIVARVATVLKNGAIAVLPAEGVYGYHAVASDYEAIMRLALLKGRDPAQGGKGWIALVGRSEDAYRWVRAVPAPTAALIRAHWPGALTLVFDAGPALPAALRSADGTVALRCPGSAFLRDVILAAGGLLVSTSANDPGAPPMTSATGPAAAEAAKVGLVVDAGTLSGQVSTIVRFDGERVIVVRSGSVPIAGSHP